MPMLDSGWAGFSGDDSFRQRRPRLGSRRAGPQRPCGWCGLPLTAAEDRRHFPVCPKRPADPRPAEWSPIWSPSGVRHGRRNNVRYPLDLEAECSFRARRAVPVQFLGHVRDISSSGCCLDLLKPGAIRVDMCAELRIAWPATLPGDIGLQFFIWGRVVRVDGLRIAVAIHRYEFRTKAHRPAQI